MSRIGPGRLSAARSQAATYADSGTPGRAGGDVRVDLSTPERFARAYAHLLTFFARDLSVDRKAALFIGLAEQAAPAVRTQVLQELAVQHVAVQQPGVQTPYVTLAGNVRIRLVCDADTRADLADAVARRGLWAGVQDAPVALPTSQRGPVTRAQTIDALELIPRELAARPMVTSEDFARCYEAVVAARPSPEAIPNAAICIALLSRVPHGTLRNELFTTINNEGASGGYVRTANGSIVHVEKGAIDAQTIQSYTNGQVGLVAGVDRNQHLALNFCAQLRTAARNFMDTGNVARTAATPTGTTIPSREAFEAAVARMTNQVRLNWHVPKWWVAAALLEHVEPAQREAMEDHLESSAASIGGLAGVLVTPLTATERHDLADLLSGAGPWHGTQPSNRNPAPPMDPMLRLDGTQIKRVTDDIAHFIEHGAIGRRGRRSKPAQLDSVQGFVAALTRLEASNELTRGYPRAWLVMALLRSAPAEVGHAVWPQLERPTDQYCTRATLGQQAHLPALQMSSAQAQDLRDFLNRTGAWHGEAPSEIPGGQLRALLGANGVLLDEVMRDPRRAALMQQRDFAGEATTADHLLRIAAAARTVDGGKTGVQLAVELLRHVGLAPNGSNANCYGRTLSAIFPMFRPADFVRLIGSLAVDGRVTLASGQVVTWDPRFFAVNGLHTSYLFAGLTADLRSRIVPNPKQLEGAMGYANHGEMANLMTRLTGERWVNVYPRSTADGAQRTQAVAQRNFPLLAEFGNHGGSFARLAGQDVSSLECGGQYQTWPVGNLGYVVMPEREARAEGLTIQQFAANDQYGYLDPSTLPRLRNT